jgi:hypothetical protein
MPAANETEAIREAVGRFEPADALQDAIDALMSSGFDRAELSLLAAEHVVEEKLGHRYRKVAELEDDPKAARCSYVSTESVGAHHAHHLQEQLEHGGMLLWVRTWDAADEQRAVEILKKHSGRDVHIHDIAATA